MIKKSGFDIKAIEMDDKEIRRVKKKVLIGPEDGSHNIIMRKFTVSPDGFTPFHTHDFEHVVKIENGKGIVIDESGKKIPVVQGDVLFINNNEEHQFQNPFDEPFEFLCIILNQGKN
ncbi:MAG: cupin domain-containing protein [Candidatus Aminicenantes bacterium]|nr:cupin domain-containing protein [Candidatus Aminicenantes bacterium]